MMGSHIKIVLHNGHSESVAVATAKGDPENPLSAEELDAKFLNLAAAAGISNTAARSVAETILRMPCSANLEELNTDLVTVASELALQV